MAELLVEQKLTVCVQIGGPVDSVDRWQGEQQTSEELRGNVQSSRVAPQISFGDGSRLLLRPRALKIFPDTCFFLGFYMLAPAESTSHLGLGLYSVPEAARLLRAPTATVRRWVSAANGLVARQLPPDEDTLTFAELIELHFVKMFRDEGVSLQTIRKTSKKAAERFNATYPLSVKGFDTDGKTIFATVRDEASSREMIEDLERGQYVFEKIMRPFFHKLDYDQAEPVRYWPLSKRKTVVIDPARKLGKPIDPASGVSTRVIAQAVAAGDGQSPAQVSKWLGVSLAAVKAAVEFERGLAT